MAEKSQENALLQRHWKIKVVSWLICEQEAKPPQFGASEEASRTGMHVAGLGVQELMNHKAVSKLIFK